MASIDSVLGDICDAFLEACTTALAAADRNVPALSHITTGKPVIVPGREELAVWLDSVLARPFGERRPDEPGDLQVKGVNYIAVVRLQLWRCFPGVTDASPVADPVAVSQSSRELMRDAWAMNAEIVARTNAGTLVPSWVAAQQTVRQDIGLGQLTPLPNLGGMAGWQINAEVSAPVILVAEIATT